MELLGGSKLMTSAHRGNVFQRAQRTKHESNQVKVFTKLESSEKIANPTCPLTYSSDLVALSLDYQA